MLAQVENVNNKPLLTFMSVTIKAYQIHNVNLA